MPYMLVIALCCNDRKAETVSHAVQTALSETAHQEAASSSALQTVEPKIGEPKAVEPKKEK